MEDGGNFGVYQELLQVSLQGSKNCKNSWHFYDFLCPSQLELRVFQAKVMYDAGCAPTVVKDRSSRAKPSHTSGACFPKEISGSTACLRRPMWPMCSDSSGLTPNGTACCPATLQREVSLTSETTASTNSQVSRSETPVGKKQSLRRRIPSIKMPRFRLLSFSGVP